MAAPSFSAEYMRVSTGLLGKDISNITPEQLQRYERMLYDFNMGYYRADTMNPWSSVAFIKEENEYYHPLSFEETGKRYGFNKLHEVIPMDAYLKLPAYMVDDFISGITKGKEQRFKVDKAQNPEDGGGNIELKDVAGQLADILKKMNK